MIDLRFGYQILSTKKIRYLEKNFGHLQTESSNGPSGSSNSLWPLLYTRKFSPTVLLHHKYHYFQGSKFPSICILKKLSDICTDLHVFYQKLVTIQIYEVFLISITKQELYVSVIHFERKKKLNIKNNLYSSKRHQDSLT